MLQLQSPNKIKKQDKSPMSFSNKNLRAILPLFLTVFVDAISMGIILPVLTPLFLNDNGILGGASSELVREFLYSLTLFSFAFGMFFSTPILGELSDEIGRKKILIFCLSGVALSYFLSVLAVIYACVSLLIFSRLLAGICAGSIATAQAAVIDICPQEEKTKYLSLLLFPVSIGFVAGPLFSAIFTNTHFYEGFNSSTPLLVAGVLATMNLIYLIYGFKETHVQKGKHKMHFLKAFGLFKDAFHHTSLRLLMVIFFFFEVAWFLYFQYIAVFMYQRFHYTDNQIGLFMAFMALGFSLAFLYIIPKLAAHYSNRKLFFASCIISTIFNLLMVWLPWASVIWILSFLNSIGNAIGYSSSIALFSDSMSKQHQGWIMGVTAAISSLALGVAALLGGLLSFIHVNLILYVTALSTFIAVVLCLRLKNFNHRNIKNWLV
jgi:DHA1 family tetracycline resistance protein-like MFS transporter